MTVFDVNYYHLLSYQFLQILSVESKEKVVLPPFFRKFWWLSRLDQDILCIRP